MKALMLLSLLTAPMLANAIDDNPTTYACSRLDGKGTIIFSRTSIVNREPDGAYGEPSDVESFEQRGESRMWSTSEGIRFIELKNQVFVMMGDKVLGKIVCD